MIGTKLAHYEITSHLGTGGMGEVYQATDTKLGRSVAIKLLPAAFASDADRLSRFRREAQLLASLNHPNIAHIYGLEESGDTRCIVMELVEGETLQARTDKSALPINDVLRYGAQIADALAEAHSKTITHRDLKPSNVMISKKGVKVLDFGLAKLSDTDGTLTQTGAVMGTIAYMAPEQMEGKTADARTDIFALGLVLYEMATGKRVVPGQLPNSNLEGLPDRFAHVVERCLAREPDNRWQSASDVKAELEWASRMPTAPAVVVVGAYNRWQYVVAALVAATIVAIWGLWQFRQTPRDERNEHVTRLQIEPPSGGRFSIGGNANVGGLALSPDGRTAAFVANVGQQTALWVRPLDSDSAWLLPGTESAAYPFWSPDGKSIAFMAKGKVQRVDVAGGSPVTMWETQGAWGGAWLPNGRIVLSSAVAGGLLQAPSPGGTLTPLTELDTSRKEIAHLYPQALPGDRLLYLAESSIPGNSAVYAISLSKPAERVRVLNTNVNALYASGYLLWWNGGTLVAQEFDPATSKLGGEPHPLAERVSLHTPDTLMDVAVSANGYLLYDTSGTIRQMQWFDPSGKPLGPPSDRKDVGLFRISPDGFRVAVTQLASTKPGVWVMDQNDLASLVTSQGRGYNSPIWSPDGRTLVFTMQSPVLNLFRMDASGSGDPTRLTQSPNVQFATDWSRDGRFILFYENAPVTQRDLWVLPVTPQGVPDVKKARTYLNTRANESWGRFSPEANPHWVAYQSDELGNFEIYIQSFPEPHGRIRISRHGGSYPMWGPDGHELYYMTLDNKLVAVSLKFGADSVETSAPRELFALPPAQSGAGSPPYDIAPNGRRFAVRIEVQNNSGLTLVTNWPLLIKKSSVAQ